MIGREGFLFFLLLSVMGCAQPKYIKGNQGVGLGGAEKPSGTTCDLVFESEGLCMSWYWVQEPTTQDSGKILLKTFRLNHFDKTPVPASLSIAPVLTLWMPSMGHGSTPSVVSIVDIGTYLVEDVFFVMLGEWDLHFQIKVDGEVTDEVVVPIRI
ncbi:MAG: hypothetical protein CL677_00480 [Bdellovibrionaceae bacterium]|nr:hypothetical protein [Pseudobdellovibrionaceae bacterium]|tara:strand:- start:36319 stop:36783 length:465 start_codon:yes stop_codon:yes gene_type:complete